MRFCFVLLILMASTKPGFADRVEQANPHPEIAAEPTIPCRMEDVIINYVDSEIERLLAGKTRVTAEMARQMRDLDQSRTAAQNEQLRLAEEEAIRSRRENPGPEIELSKSDVIYGPDEQARSRMPRLPRFNFDDVAQDERDGPPISWQSDNAHHTDRHTVVVSEATESLPAGSNWGPFHFPQVEVNDYGLTSAQLMQIIHNNDIAHPLGKGGMNKVYVLAGTEGGHPPLLVRAPIRHNARMLARLRSRQLALNRATNELGERLRARGRIDSPQGFDSLSTDSRQFLARYFQIHDYAQYEAAVAARRIPRLEYRGFRATHTIASQWEFDEIIPPAARANLRRIGILNYQDLERSGIVISDMVGRFPRGGNSSVGSIGQFVANNIPSAQNIQTYINIYESVAARSHGRDDLHLYRGFLRRSEITLAHVEPVLGNADSPVPQLQTLRRIRDPNGGYRDLPANAPVLGPLRTPIAAGYDFGPTEAATRLNEAFSNDFIDEQGDVVSIDN